MKARDGASTTGADSPALHDVLGKKYMMTWTTRLAAATSVLAALLGGACNRDEDRGRRDRNEPPVVDVTVDAGAAAPRPAPPADGGQGVPRDTTTDLAPSAIGCEAISLQAGDRVEGSAADTFSWSDARCARRSAALLRNDARDAFGQHGGYLRSYTYVVDGKVRTLKGTGTRADSWNGFGYLVNHYADAYTDNRQVAGRHRTLLAGPHHAIHEFKVQVRPGGPVDATVHWFFATGRSHPLFAVTFDARGAAPDALRADTRAPYGDLAWDDGKGGRVDGLGWGDARRLRTTSPLSARAGWSYEGDNVVPHALAWSLSSDAEMGLVGTEAFATRPQGGDYGGGALQRMWGKRGGSLLTDIPDWQWPFQINQYELPVLDSSHRLAWGSSYGAVGQRAYAAFGKMLRGYPYQSYTVAVVLGTHQASATEATIADFEAALATRVSATRGTLALRGSAGAGRSDEAPFAHPGWDPVYAAWTLDGAANTAALRLDTTGTTLTHPVFLVRGYTASQPPGRVLLDGSALEADRDYFASIDDAGDRLWLTLNQTLRGVATIAIE